MSELARESRALLEAARSGDDPRAEDRARIRQRLFQAGVGAAVMTVTTSTTASVASSAAGSGGATGLAASGAASSAVGGGAAVATGAASMGIVAKVLVALAITGTVSATGVKAVSVYRTHEQQRVALLQTPQGRSLATSAPASPGAAATPSVADPVADSPSDSPAVVAADPVDLAHAAAPENPAPRAPAAAIARTAPRRSVEAPASPESTLESETRLLQDAEKRRRAGDGEGALALLAEHASRFPNGVLTEERAAARVFTLCDLGRWAEASLEGEKFLQNAPRSPLAARVRASCARRP